MIAYRAETAMVHVVREQIAREDDAKLTAGREAPVTYNCENLLDAHSLCLSQWTKPASLLWNSITRSFAYGEGVCSTSFRCSNDTEGLRQIASVFSAHMLSKSFRGATPFAPCETFRPG